MRSRLILVLSLFVLLMSSPAHADQRWEWPLGDRQVDRDFDPPSSAYGPGHRGVDLPGRHGHTVRSVAAGRVSFVGEVAGTPVITVDHGSERSTYQPVLGSVEVGDAVDAGEPIGTLLGGHAGCGSPACLHLGRLAGEVYLDPLERLSSASRIRLIDPHGPPPGPPPGLDGQLRRPVGGPITSAYGMRVHPVTGERKLHDGTDFAAPCGTPVQAAASGTVAQSGVDGAYGQRVVVRHGDDDATSYSHLSRRSVAAGDRVDAGDVIGQVGTTGLSTGCHLHFSVHRGGTTIDPAPLL